ncbi:hypothetical protein JG687_00008664 [Phytophthora cactorum]|uniref:Uncharacterized protein n=1 Tax=Phytophthora cactorum TaxID=29920 RepID=A0A329SEJ8_9STRA|nr:hypothetical protein GQ600_18571 [Phytophthora cactorum]KAG2863457.1 hypothetical protein PC113_g5441 [Phytophthora cactorum]KAG2899181.1 hypothetical protein PC115_g16618 [Phytophthora cactorum]KAG3226559.1 hypothetical protein PC129_g2855 [Phytophthora cactorum]KAG6959636.1 hypothetical protein JG687_00008664 [Phytophthora cactorum]
MGDFHMTMEKMDVIIETVEWVETTSLYIPDGLDEYAYLNKQDATTAVRRIVLPMARDSPFGRLSIEALVLFRKKNG